jgi:hypothetical protein
MRFVLLAWVQFIGGLLILGSIDFYIRWRDGWLGSTGMPTPDVIWFGVPLLLGIVAILLLWCGTASIQSPWARIGAIAAQAIVGFVIYMAASLWYVIETGVDSL